MERIMDSINPLDIQEWKNKHKHLIHVVDETEQYEAYFKMPTIEVLQEYAIEKENDIYVALAHLFEKCVLTTNGENSFFEDDFKIAAAKSILQKVSLDKQVAIDNTTGKDEIRKSAALVRHYFNVDPYELPADEFYKLLAEALWLQDHKNKQLEYAIANTLVKVLGDRA